MEKGRMKRPKRIELHEVDAGGQIVGIIICDEKTAVKKGLLKNKKQKGSVKNES
ncbi:hypothetical protein [Bacillus alveayuensis]|uniref:hypothetical protein n=1 Tax=Aeribacillus alveayuensis TaxID=279215 RepID=UPI001364DE61|nr:hypothetical protein [Bacillus alveayuensis]